MSRGNEPKLDLNLNLSPLRARRPLAEDSSPSRSQTVSLSSTISSCLSSDMDAEGEEYSTSPETTSMMLVGCQRCLLYVMLSEEDPRCPKCKSSVLIDVINNASTTATSRGLKKTSDAEEKEKHHLDIPSY